MVRSAPHRFDVLGDSVDQPLLLRGARDARFRGDVDGIHQLAEYIELPL
jgi:hypothetical protein